MRVSPEQVPAVSAMEVAAATPAWRVCSDPLWHFWVSLCRTRNVSRVCFFRACAKWFASVCLSLAGRSWSLVLVKEQSCHFRQSGEGGRYDPVSGCVMFWTCITFFCLVCSMFIAHGLAGEVKGVGVAWSGEVEAEGGT